jgi:hypothetical protein
MAAENAANKSAVYQTRLLVCGEQEALAEIAARESWQAAGSV